MHGLALCAGAGGLELGLHIALPGYRTVGYVEREAHAAAALVARMADSALDTAPVWDDVATFDGRPWRGIVDLVSGGYPCQGESNAGRRRGVDDPRWMWPHFRRILDDTGAEWGFFENVGPHLSRSFPVVLDDLQGLGYRVAAGLFTAFEAGASHQRERLFILAHRPLRGRQRQLVSAGQGAKGGRATDPAGDGEDVEHPTVIGGGASRPCRRDGPQGRHELDPTGQCLEDAAGLGWEVGGGCPLDAETEGRTALPVPAGGHLADASGCRLRSTPSTPSEEGSSWPQYECSWRHQGGPEGCGSHLADTCGTGLAGTKQPGQPGPEKHRDESGATASQLRRALPLAAPGPADPRWGEVLDLDPTLEPALCGVAHAMAHRVDRLRLTGNGVHPLAAALAFRTLRDALAHGGGR